jgi:HSP20 family molecular chaperone IbpA
VIDLPGAADTSRIDARLERGVLVVVLPRIRERRGRRREVPIG